MRTKLVRAGGIAALMVPVALWGGGVLGIALTSSPNAPAAAGRAFEEALGAVAALLIAAATAATWWPMAAAGRRKAGLVIFALVAVLLVAAALSAALGAIAIAANHAGSRELQAAGALAHALCFALALLFGAALIELGRDRGDGGAGRGFWVAAGVLYIIAAIMAAPSWAFLAYETAQGSGTTMRFARELAAVLGLLVGTLLVLPAACVCHGLALLREARAAEARPVAPSNIS